MVKTLKFVYYMILFLSLFLFIKNVDGAFVKCETDDDCPKYNGFRKYECVNNWCRLTGLH
ncbi:putative Late nodulin [Medicago truncatula]|uniref:Nodule Cysteine-Rich (NCR) secreted peptide n=1 Tax=Medicago truncatula TaxID=3880 RepID=A0A072UKH2_MEDTR|nr:Nodule Cysteine-Rich (NCR) secreted peptide [Medicago truncatula]RHN51491.1 putative Late nodulin [Medicago truncatula]